MPENPIPSIPKKKKEHPKIALTYNYTFFGKNATRNIEI
jgi:hypothetical protein